MGITPGKHHLIRAKVSFNKRITQSSEDEKRIIEQQLNIIPNTFEQGKAAKSKKPAVANKAFTFDQKKERSNSSHRNKESRLIQGMSSNDSKKDKKIKVSMDIAENFFVKQQDQIILDRKNNTNYFEKYVSDKDLIEEKLKKGLLWKGQLRTPRFRHRAFVSINELDIDVLVEGQKLMNRAFDGDSVIIELLPVHSWIENTDQNSI